jgi:ActR/RegA family two-component response regulator
MDRVDGNISAAAREAELDRKHLRTLLRKHALIEHAETDEA